MANNSVDHFPPDYYVSCGYSEDAFQVASIFREHSNMSKKKNKNRNTGSEKMDNKEKDEIQEEIVAETMDDVMPEEEQEAASDNTEENPLEAKVEELEAELKKKDEEVAAIKDRMLRNQAEAENYKKRLLKDKEDAVKYANTSLVKDLLGPLDDFSRALDAAEKTENFEAMKEGVRMIEDRLYTLLKNNWGLEVIDQADVAFDPNEHEACMMEEKEGLTEDTVTMVLQKGFRLNGRVIRPAKVMVGKPKTV